MMFLFSQDGHEPILFIICEKISMSISKYDDCSLFSICIELFLSFFAEDTWCSVVLEDIFVKSLFLV